MTKKAAAAKLRTRVSTICNALVSAEVSRILVDWRHHDLEHAPILEAMRQAVEQVDGTLEVTTDALEAAWLAGLRAAKKVART